MDVVEMVTEIETVGDYGMQVTDVVDGKCIGCDHSNESWCRKHQQWGFAINNCGNEPPPPEKKMVKHLSQRTAHNAKPVKCSNGVTYQSLFLAAKAFKVTPEHLRKMMLAGKDYATFTFEFAEVEK